MKTFNFHELQQAHKNPELRIKGFDDFNKAQEINASRYINILNHRHGWNNDPNKISFINKESLLESIYYNQTLPLSNAERLNAIAQWIKENNGRGSVGTVYHLRNRLL